MELGNFAASFLIFISALFGVTDAPDPDPVWKHQSGWSEEIYPQFIAESSSILEQCENDLYLQLPMVIHGAHRVFVDGELRAQFGDPEFVHASKIYNSPVVSCQALLGNNLRWEATSYSQYFARALNYPLIVEQPYVEKRFFIMIASGIPLIMLALGLIMMVDLSSVRTKHTYCFIVACSGWALFILSMNGGGQLIDLTMSQTHRLADSSLWLGSVGLFRCFMAEGWISKRLFNIFMTHIAVAIPLILFGTDGDWIQLGTSIPFPMLLICSVAAMRACLRQESEATGPDILKTLNILMLAVFTVSAFHDVGLTVGLYPGLLWSPYGVLITLTLLAVDVSLRMRLSYRTNNEH